MPTVKFNRLNSAMSRKKALDWALVLHAMGIPNEILRLDSEYRISVPDAYRKSAETQIRLYERELSIRNRILKGDSVKAHTARRVSWPMLFSFPVLFYLFQIVQLKVYEIPWTDAGYSSAEKILKGEWWRAVTGLFLHADVAHFTANMVFGTAVAYFLSAILGGGLSWLLILTAGIAGNMLNAVLYQTGHDSIGFSTAVMGAVGILTGLELTRIVRRGWKKVFIPLVGGLALFGLFGTSPGTDIFAHLSGFLCGILTGAIAGFVLKKTKKPSAIFQIGFLFAAIAMTVAGWALALFIK